MKTLRNIEKQIPEWRILNQEQRKQIEKGLEQGLTIEQVRLYAKPEFDSDQMREIREGFLKGLSTDQIKLYATTDFDGLQMGVLRKFLLKHNNKPVNELYKKVKDKLNKTKEEQLFIEAYELKIKKNVCREIIRSVEQKIPQKPKIKMRL